VHIVSLSSAVLNVSVRACTQRCWILKASKTNEKITTSNTDVRRDRKTSKDVQIIMKEESGPSIRTVLVSIQGSLTTLALINLRATLKKAPQQLSPLLTLLDKLSPPPIPPPTPEIPMKRDFRDELGVLAPIGFFDPIGTE